MKTFNVQGQVISKTLGTPIPWAKVTVFSSAVVGNERSAAAYVPLAPLTQDTGWDGKFSIDIASPSAPDVYFRVSQVIDGAERIIYNENPATQARHHIPDVLGVTLRTDQGLAFAGKQPLRPYEDLFVFTRVGTIGVDEIDTVGTGYAYPTPPATGEAANSPFGSTLDVAGFFGQLVNIWRYKIQYSTDGQNWTDVNDPLSNTYFEFLAGGGHWVTVALGPFTEGGQQNVYKLPYVERPGQPWIFPDLLARWDTTKVPNGTYTLRLLGFVPDPSGNQLVPITFQSDPKYSTLNLRIDNDPPSVHIDSFTFPDGTQKTVDDAACAMVPFGTTGATGHLLVHFTAFDPNGHLASYSLDANYGHNKTVSPQPPGAHDSFAAHLAAGSWNGGTVTADYDPATYTAGKMPQCAYEFALVAPKRTTNGYSRIYSGGDALHLTILRP
jgi:hypothetical protein